MQPGTIVHLRDRDWVLLPSDDEKIYRLRPLTGATDELVAVHKELATLIAYDLPHERLQPSQFPPPSPDDLSDAASAHLLWQAARLTLRDGAGPFRSLGRISIRPRTYQFVPLLMALRLDPVRLFIADDVGVGKTIEALLIARELIDRGEVRRLAVLCPPYLCEQWEKELQEKFNLEPVVIRSSTISQLERHKPNDRSIYEYFPIQVISIDWVKSDRNKHQFLQFCPELVIVDEAHGAAEASPRNKSQQQRHQLLQEIAQDEKRHLILLTATPHSGVEAAFRSLLGLLRPEFRQWDIGSLNEPQRIELARHFVQRTRKDIIHDWEGKHCFPERLSVDATYRLSDKYRQLFEKTYTFCSEIVRTGQDLEERKRRVRYWGALALLRCVMSSPKAAVTALKKRTGEDVPTQETPNFGPFVFETSDDLTDDETPTPPIEEAEKDLPHSDRSRLRELARLASELLYTPQDTKLACCIEVVQNLLKEGFHPIIWCRYVATAEYVAEGLQQALNPEVQVICITGRIGDEERRAKIDEIDTNRPRVLVATDCLSEGINLQEKFTAVLHYDLPWNPNRLEQREGRVDRYGQTAPKVKAVRFYGRDNPVDGAVIEVLLDKAREIHKTLGTYVPVPEESETVMQAVLNSLFLRRREEDPQLLLPLFGETEENETLRQFHQRWALDAERERINRTRFAQRALKPEEVKRELEATDAVLGDPEAVREFVLNAGQRIGLSIHRDPKQTDVFCIDLSTDSTATLPDAIRAELPDYRSLLAAHRSPNASPTARRSPTWRISFVSPTPEGAEYIGRNHRFVAALARYLLEEALTKGKDAVVSRCGVLRTRAVDLLTTLLILRVRYLVEIPERTPLLSEEVLVMGYQFPGTTEEQWLNDGEALRLLADAQPDENIPYGEKRELVEMVLGEIGEWRIANDEWGEENNIQKTIRQRIHQRARKLEESHKRIRKAVSLRVRELKVKPQFPPDLLGILILQPAVKP
ncbi:MAG: DEAD/DEAH box helicase [Anaerolineae bacterium]|nr:DEAD/DEAH box helicase [Anaerolineae bacterium]